MQCPQRLRAAWASCNKRIWPQGHKIRLNEKTAEMKISAVFSVVRLAAHSKNCLCHAYQFFYFPHFAVQMVHFKVIHRIGLQ